MNKKLGSNNQNQSKTSSQESQTSNESDHYYYPPEQETELGKESEIYSKFPIATPRTNRRDLKVVEKFLLDLLERNEINNSTQKSKEGINKSKVDKPSPSKLHSSIEEIQEEHLNEEAVEGQEEMSSTDRIHQKVLKIQEKLLEIIKKEGKKKSTSYTPQNSTLEEQTTLPKSFRPDGSPSPYPRPMATSTPYTKQIQNTLPIKVNISSQITTPSHQEIPRNTTPIVKIRHKDYNLWFDGKDVERLIKKAENISQIDVESGRDIARQIAFLEQR
ncbi:hypothetical protein O181_020854 [Austropuccinia psidii MF-1]|uniref:Uncharacterized protein n=1 Tax=Austropuccinia psidii MF-1 TaxID=1389203 RepID=A0A9Q3C9P3_9BASI|nr:hypothetical protein [Austropuccinia psidii MF-1]